MDTEFRTKTEDAEPDRALLPSSLIDDVAGSSSSPPFLDEVLKWIEWIESCGYAKIPPVRPLAVDRVLALQDHRTSSLPHWLVLYLELIEDDSRFFLCSKSRPSLPLANRDGAERRSFN